MSLVFLHLVTLVAALLLVFSLADYLLHPRTPTVVLPKTTCEELAKYISADTVFYDIGSGYGDVLLYLSRRFPRATFVGIENSFLALLVSKVRLAFTKNVELKFGWFEKFTYVDATIIFSWLYVTQTDVLHKKLLIEKFSRGKYVSADFPVTGIAPITVIKVSETARFGHTLYIYEF